MEFFLPPFFNPTSQRCFACINFAHLSGQKQLATLLTCKNIASVKQHHCFSRIVQNEWWYVLSTNLCDNIRKTTRYWPIKTEKKTIRTATDSSLLPTY